MLLHVKILGSKEIYPTVPGNASSYDLKAEIQREHGIPASQQKLVFRGKTLSDDKTLAEYSITENSKLHLVIKKVDKALNNTVPEKPSFSPDDFWLTLEQTLSKQYDLLDVKRIMDQYKVDYKQMIATMSLDDIERIASRQLKS